jgi:cardiolipin synthase
MSVLQNPQPLGVRLACGTLLVCLGLAGCASVPQVNETEIQPSKEIRLVGSRGPLTARQSKAILDRLAAQAPNAGALERHLAIEQAVAESPLVAGNQVKILRDGDQTFPAMFAAIHAAQHYLLLEYYIFEDVNYNGEHLGDLLVSKARAGVQIDVIYDGVGSIDTPSEFFDRLHAAGIQVVQFNPPNPLTGGRRFSINDRDHRKMLIADGALVIVGGVNLSTSYESAPGAARTPAAPGGAAEPTKNPPDVWHDTDLQITGPVVAGLQRLFEEHWREQQGPPLQFAEAERKPAGGDEVIRIIGSAPKRQTPRYRYYVTLLTAIRTAETRIWVMTAYFVPTHQEKEGLIHAARAGIDVRLLLPSHSDSSPALEVQHSHYSDLLRAGVKIYERTDGILHSKSVAIDGVWSMVGSSNFDHRSVLFNDEVDAVVLGTDTGAQLEALFQGDLQHATAINLDEWRKRGELTKLREQFWKLWEKLL